MVIALPSVWKIWYEEYKFRERRKKGKRRTKVKMFYKFITIVLFTLFKIIWDCVVVTFDILTFAKLDNGEHISEYIQRNIHVNNAILVFACLGIIKIPFNIYTLRKVDEGYHTFNIKFLSMVLTYLSEDRFELVDADNGTSCRKWSIVNDFTDLSQPKTFNIFLCWLFKATL